MEKDMFLGAQEEELKELVYAQLFIHIWLEGNTDSSTLRKALAL